MCIREKHLFHNDIFPDFKFLLSNERLDFVNKKNNNQRINNADSFSQPPLIIFTKGADIFGHDTYIHVCICFIYLCTYFYFLHFNFFPGQCWIHT